MQETAHASHQIAGVVAVGEVNDAVMGGAEGTDEVVGNGQGGLDIEGQPAARVLEVEAQHVIAGARQVRIAVLHGCGVALHGGIEILAAILPAMITSLVVAILFSAGNTENALRTLNITEETAAAALPSVQAAAAFDYAMMAMNVMERLFALLLHIGLTVIVYYGIVKGRKNCLPMAILLHMLMDTFPALFQRGVLPLWTVEVWAAVWTVVIVLIAGKLYRKMKA